MMRVVKQFYHVLTIVMTATTIVMNNSNRMVVNAYRGNGAYCLAHFQCVGWCNWDTGFCEAKFPQGSPCTVGVHDQCETERCSAAGTCEPKGVIGDPCVDHVDCWESYCSENVCTEYIERHADELIREDTPDLCDVDFQCRSQRCTAKPKRCTFQKQENAECTKDNDCLDGRCKTIIGQEGFGPSVPGGRCIKRKMHNETCADDTDCLTLRCDAGPDGEPVCLEPMFPGNTGCNEASDCYLQLCNPETTVCVENENEIPDGIPYGPVPGRPDVMSEEPGGNSAIIVDDPNLTKSDGGRISSRYFGGAAFLLSMALVALL